MRASGKYDFVFLDAQAGADQYAHAAAAIAGQRVVVSEYDPVSTQGIDRLKILFGRVLDPSSTWILFNKVLPEFASVIGEGLSIARYLPPIPWDGDVVRAFARRDLAIDLKSPNPFTIAISQLALSLFPDFTFRRVEEWRHVSLDSAVAPARQRIEELDIIIKNIGARELRGRKMRLILDNMIFLLLPLTMLPALSEYLNLDRYMLLFVELLPPFLVFLFVWLSIFMRELGRRISPDMDASARVEREKLIVTISSIQEALKVGVGGIYGQRRRLAHPSDEPLPPNRA